MRIEFVVSFEKPHDATVAECREYVREAVETWRGQLRPPGSYDDNDPGDPLWELKSETVKVVRKRAK